MDYICIEKQITASGKWQARVIISDDESIFLKFNDEPSQFEINREAESYVLRKRLAEIRDEPVPDTQPEALASRLTKLQYMNRFRDDELATIYAAAKVSPAVEVWLEKFKLSEFVDTADVRTTLGLQALESAGLIGAGRAAEILS